MRTCLGSGLAVAVLVGLAASTAGATPSSAAPSPRYHATIQRTTDGVPHITGARLADVIYGEGYANAEDHGCTLADAMLTPLSRRAATFGAGDGDANVDSDFAWKSIGLDAIARADFATASDNVRMMMTSYADGWNAYLNKVGPAGLNGWCAGQDWVKPISAEDLYVYARSITLLASSGSLARMIPNAQPPASATPGAGTQGKLNGAAFNVARPGQLGSNAWALGKDKVTGHGGGMLIANPHFPWEGSLRFWEVHLTVPGTMDVYGGMLIGLPGVGIGFTSDFAWSHTVSAGHRFTAYTLNLAPGDPTSYVVDGNVVPMTATDHSVGVRQPDGSTTAVKRTLYRTEYGPVIDFPGYGWTAEHTISFRDANIDNDEFVDQYLAMDTAKTFDAFVEAHKVNQGVPLFNTIAVSRDGRAWYADTAATPKLSAEAEALYGQRLASDPITKIAADNGAILLDGSDSRFRWEEVPGARDPGLVPFEQMPMIERSDYVFNANDSFWMSHGTVMLEGPYSVMHGEQRTERSLRTRENAAVLDGPDSAAGPDGTFTSAEIRDAALGNRAGSARLLRQGVVDRCTTATGPVEVAEVANDDGSVAIPAGPVDVASACRVLGAWDGTFNVDSKGAVLWHEFFTALRKADGGMSALWLFGFDPSQPVLTPAGLQPAPTGQPDPVLVALAKAVAIMDKAGQPLDVALGDVQYRLIGDGAPRIGLGGGTGPDGLTNVIDYGDSGNTSEPVGDPGARVAPGSDLRTTGYPVDRGTSFVLNVDFSAGAPAAWAMLTYGETGDRSDPNFTVQTTRFANKDWRPVAFTAEQVAAAATGAAVEVGS